MRVLVPVLTFVLLLSTPLASLAATGKPSTGKRNPHLSQDCRQVDHLIAAQGRPSGQAQLIASHAVPQQHSVRRSPAPEVHSVQRGETLFRIANRYDTTVGEIVATNDLMNPNRILVGQRLRIPGATTAPAPAPARVERLPAPLQHIWLDGRSVQGEATLLWIQAVPGSKVTGHFRNSLGEQVIPFYRHCNLLWGMVAFDALHDAPGVHEIELRVKAPGWEAVTASLPLRLEGGDYRTYPIIRYPSDKQRLLDPEVVSAENDRLNRLFASLPRTPPRWSGPFKQPLDSFVTQQFATMGSVNGAPPKSYHKGIDYRGATGTPIPASAPGTVVLAEFLTVRGGTVYIDHGAGVVTGYFHMSQIDARVGDEVQVGDVIGKVGTTGLSTGPHLHWELLVNGRAVNPEPWVRRAVP